MKALLVGLLWALSVSVSLAQNYPSKPVRFIVPYPPGGGNDTVARLLATKLTEQLGQQVVIENRPGAQGNIGTAAGAKAAPDGYTITLSFIGTFAINPALYKELGFDPIRDFVQVSLVAVQPYVVVVNPGVPAKKLKELVALAKARPNGLTFASTAAPAQLAGELFQRLTGTKMLHVPYKGAGPAAIDLLGGHVDLMFAGPTSAVPQVKSGKLRALAVTAPTRLAALPDVPTSRESGFPDFEISGWYGVAVPNGTPKEVVSRLNSVLARVLSASDVKDRLQNDGLEAKGSSSQEMAAFVKSELERWSKVVKASGMKVD